MKKNKSNPQKETPTPINIFTPRKTENPFATADAAIHVYGKKQNVCSTDSRGYPTPKNKNDAELVVGTSEGFIPLWAKNVMLRWRFSPSMMNYFQNPDAAKKEIRQLFGEAILAWGDAAPVKFKEVEDAWDFEITVKSDDYNIYGCTLASAFFPDAGRHQLIIHPKMFAQSRVEQVETLIHETGHIFGLRHFFAEISETEFPSEIFGEHERFTIMNYGAESVLTETDKSDLKRLYKEVWSGELTEINGTKIVMFEPFHSQVGV